MSATLPVQVSAEKMRALKAQTVPTEAFKKFEKKRKQALEDTEQNRKETAAQLRRVGEVLRNNADSKDESGKRPPKTGSAKDEKTKNKSGEKQKEKVAKNEDQEENQKSGEKTGSSKDEKTKTKPEEKQKENAAKKKSTEPSEEKKPHEKTGSAKDQTMKTKPEEKQRDKEAKKKSKEDETKPKSVEETGTAQDQKTKTEPEKKKKKKAQNEDQEENQKSGEKTGSAKDQKTKTTPEEKQKEKAAQKKSTEPSEEKKPDEKTGSAKDQTMKTKPEEKQRDKEAKKKSKEDETKPKSVQETGTAKDQKTKTEPEKKKKKKKAQNEDQEENQKSGEKTGSSKDEKTKTKPEEKQKENAAKKKSTEPSEEKKPDEKTGSAKDQTMKTKPEEKQRDKEAKKKSKEDETKPKSVEETGTAQDQKTKTEPEKKKKEKAQNEDQEENQKSGEKTGSSKDQKTKTTPEEKQREKVAKNEDQENKKSGEKTGSAKDEKTKTKPEEKQKEKAAKKKSTEPSEEKKPDEKTGSAKDQTMKTKPEEKQRDKEAKKKSKEDETKPKSVQETGTAKDQKTKTEPEKKKKEKAQNEDQEENQKSGEKTGSSKDQKTKTTPEEKQTDSGQKPGTTTSATTALKRGSQQATGEIQPVSPDKKKLKSEHANQTKRDLEKVPGQSPEKKKAKGKEPQWEEQIKFRQDPLKDLERVGTLDSIELATPRRELSFSAAQARHKAVTDLTTDQKESILAMTKPSDLNPDERKRQYSSLRFTMLKSWMTNPDLSSIDVEEKYVSYVEQLRTDRYTTVTILQLEKIYGRSKGAQEFIAQSASWSPAVASCQAPSCPKARMYKVLKEVVEDTSTGKRAETNASLKGRVRDDNAKKLIAKQLGGLMDDVPSFDLKTGQIKTKKAKKEKSPEDMAVQELKQLEKKLKALVNGIPSCIKEIADLNKLKIPVSSIIADEIAGFILVEKETVKDCDVDFRDGKRRVNAAKAPRKSRKATPADACASSAGGSERNLHSLVDTLCNSDPRDSHFARAFWRWLRKQEWRAMVEVVLCDPSRDSPLYLGEWHLFLPSDVFLAKYVNVSDSRCSLFFFLLSFVYSYWNSVRHTQWFQEHPVLSSSDCQLDRCVPLVVHGDGADSHRRRSFLVLTMGSLVVSGNFWDCKFLLYCLDESSATPDTVSTLDLWCAWSMTELQLGSYMDKDPWGCSLAAFDTGKRQGLIAGGYKGILCYHKGDEKYHQKVYRASHGAVSRNVCVTCRATNDGDMVYTAHGINAIHRTTRLSTEEFITGVCGTRTWVGVPGWHVGMLCYDWLHVVDLPVIPEVAASCLVELTEESTFGHASTADERLRLAFVAFTKACKRAGVRNRGQMFSMLRAAVFVNLVAMRAAMSDSSNTGVKLTDSNLQMLQRANYLFHSAHNWLATEALEKENLLWRTRPKYHK
ncbi:unnamed protein product [Cladocopium goreaui]|uniref:Uncharacterized protein n=1 Tax=Cladocopium goreaui TaxID=2562237 RepID=A0A9P1BJV5_9DINO|nr:unnamed protein product [Cladocopium goreaui]